MTKKTFDEDKEIVTMDKDKLLSLLASIDYKDELSREDVPIPILKIVQKGSDSIFASYPDAKIGMLFNVATEEFLGPEIEIIPCSFEAKYLKRVQMDLGGGFGGITSVKPEGFDIPKGGVFISEKEKDMEVIYTHYHAVLLRGNVPAVIPMNSTQLKVSKRWNVAFRNPLKGANLPIFSNVFSIKTMDQKARTYSFKGWSQATWVRKTTYEEIVKAAELYTFLKTKNIIEKNPDLDSEVDY